MRLPTSLADVRGQGVDHHIEALRLALEPAGQGQVVQRRGLATGIGSPQLGRIEPDHRSLQLPLVPVDPELTARPQRVCLPLPQQAWRQPACPVALRQAEVGRHATLAPGLGRRTAAQIERQRLAVGQGCAQVECLARRTGLKAEAYISQGQWIALPRA
ncbi:hypothetical protein D3C79_467080 [compost metagenome]